MISVVNKARTVGTWRSEHCLANRFGYLMHMVLNKEVVCVPYVTSVLGFEKTYDLPIAYVFSSLIASFRKNMILSMCSVSFFKNVSLLFDKSADIYIWEVICFGSRQLMVAKMNGRVGT